MKKKNEHPWTLGYTLVLKSHELSFKLFFFVVQTNWFPSRMMPWKLKQNLNCLSLGPLFKGLGTNLKLLTNMNAQFHWTLLLGSLSKVTLSFMPCWSPGHFCLLKSHPLYDQTRGSGVVLITSTPSFYINFRIDMTGFVDPNKMIARKSAFSALSSAWNESEFLKKNTI